VEAGAKLYKTNCGSCHGAKGDGNSPVGKALNPKASDLTDGSVMSKLGDDYLYWRIAEGGSGDPFNSAMAGFGGDLSEEEIWQLVAYIRSLSK
jgi:mono/diheme cytochrome c family protein